MTAGYVDGYALVLLGTFVSFMSGNTTTTGVGIGVAHLGAALSSAVAIVSFFIGSLAGNFLTEAPIRQSRRILFSVIAALMVLSLLFGRGSLKNAGIALLAIAMGMLNPAASHVGAENVNLTFVTGAVSKTARNIVLGLKGGAAPGAKEPWDTYFYRARIEAQIWVAFLIGAALAGLSTSHAPDWLVLCPAIAVVIGFALWPRPPALPGKL